MVPKPLPVAHILPDNDAAGTGGTLEYAAITGPAQDRRGQPGSAAKSEQTGGRSGR
jgi:hypothetical protein